MGAECVLHGNCEVVGIDGGEGAQVFNNVVNNIHGTAGENNTGESVGICVTDFQKGCIIKCNTITNDYKPALPLGAGASIGLWVGGESCVEAIENTIDTWDYGTACSVTAVLSRQSERYINNTINVFDAKMTH